MAGKVFSVSEISAYLKTLFVRDFVLSHIIVSGEVSNCKYHSSGHIYFTLKDALAQINCIMFAADRGGLSFHLEDGQQVEVEGRIGVYEKSGSYQLYARKCVLSGAGRLYERYLKLKDSLEEMGMFDEIYKKPIPPYCMSIGIVTAPTGAAVQDIINVSTRRNPYVRLVLFPAQVQGEGAIRSISRGILALDELGLDVIIVGRGGGSIEDLWAFNELEVAESIFNAHTPIISAVGHETDFTIADFVADLRAPTPSAAAEMANFVYIDLMQQLDSISMGLESSLLKKAQLLKTRLLAYSERLRRLAPKYALRLRKIRAQGYLDKMNRLMLSRIHDVFRQVDEISHDMEMYLDMKLSARSSRASSFSLLLNAVMTDKLEGIKEIFRYASARLDLLSPLKRMSGGYGYLLNEAGKGVRSIEDVREGEEMMVLIRDGKLRTDIIEIDPR